MQTLDFARSYLRFRVDLSQQPAITLSHRPPTSVNNVRINLECRCTIARAASAGAAADDAVVFVLGASCKTERVGGPGPLWLEPNADFCLVASAEKFLIIKSWQKRDMKIKRFPEHLGYQPERQTGLTREAWTWFSIEPAPAAGHALEGIDAIIAAIRGGRPLVARTEYEDTGWRVAIEHPVKTINYSERENVYQTDTGPILLPDFSRQPAPAPGVSASAADLSPEVFDLAFAAFNTEDWAEFVINAPTPVADGVSVNHYAKTRRIEGTRNVLLEVGGAE